jgi:hypothetical protein
LLTTAAHVGETSWSLTHRTGQTASQTRKRYESVTTL